MWPRAELATYLGDSCSVCRAWNVKHAAGRWSMNSISVLVDALRLLRTRPPVNRFLVSPVVGLLTTSLPYLYEPLAAPHSLPKHFQFIHAIDRPAGWWNPLLVYTYIHVCIQDSSSNIYIYIKFIAPGMTSRVRRWGMHKILRSMCYLRDW